MATRVASKVPGFSQDDVVMETDRGLLEKAVSMYNDRGEAFNKPNHQKHSQPYGSWGQKGHGGNGGKGGHGGKGNYGSWKRPQSQGWSSSQAKHGKY
jgi:hypothetical protein